MKMANVIIFRRVCAETIIIYRAFYKGKGNLKKARILSFGVNQLGDTYGNTPGVHAECDAISKLIPLKPKKKLENINLLVIRLSTKNKIQCSKPCYNCIETMKNYPPKIGYKLNNIYYSDSNGDIVKTTIGSLEKEEKHYSQYYRRKMLQ
jgi:cytidine deaminase